MELFFILIIFLLFFFPLVFMIILPIFRKHRKTSGGLKNYNASMNTFVYKVSLPEKGPYKLNPFMVSKLNVEIVPFAEFGSGV